jgi:hypothetical protein
MHPLTFSPDVAHQGGQGLPVPPVQKQKVRKKLHSSECNYFPDFGFLKA